MAKNDKKVVRKDEVTDHTYLKKGCFYGTILGTALGFLSSFVLGSPLDFTLLGAGLGLFFGSSYGLRKDSKLHYEKHLGD